MPANATTCARDNARGAYHPQAARDAPIRSASQTTTTPALTTVPPARDAPIRPASTPTSTPTSTPASAAQPESRNSRRRTCRRAHPTRTRTRPRSFAAGVRKPLLLSLLLLAGFDRAHAQPLPPLAAEPAAATSASAASLSTASAGPAASTAEAANTPKPSTGAEVPIGPFPFLASRPAPPDIAAFPARLDGTPLPSERGVELHGFVAAWVTPWSDPSAQRAREHFRLRFGVLRVDARPAKNVSVLARLGLMLPSSPLLDFALTYTPHDAIGVTLGQFRLPIGAAATTLAPQLVLLDRPGYVYALTKLAFRDVGVMVHSGPRGIADGLFHYRLALTSGAGRAGVGLTRPPDDLLKTLLAARGMLDLGRLLSPANSDRLVLGATYVRSTDPAIATGDIARDRELAVNVLGRTLTPIGLERVTQLGGADLTFNFGPFYAQAELLYLHSLASDGSVEREGAGSNLDLAYTLPIRPWDTIAVQLAGRIEQFNPRFDEAIDDLPNDEVQVFTLGMNLSARAVRTSLFGSITRFEDASTRRTRHAGELTLRATAAF